MKVEHLRFQNYRNLADGYISPCEGVNIIYGKNAQGKTNIIEALWLFCGGHSFRTQSYRELIQFDKPFAKLDCRFFGQERSQTASIAIEPNRRVIKLNGVEKKTSAALIERFCAVVFSPENLSLVKRGPSERRNFIDSAICREKMRNALTLQKYNRLLKQRNALLKDLQRNDKLREMLSLWDEQLTTLGAEIVRRRLGFVKMITEKAAVYHKGISRGSEQLSLRYLSSFGAEESDDRMTLKRKFQEKCALNLQNEIFTGSTIAGAHRDDIEILINGKNARFYASQGQQRSAVLSLKLAEAAVLRERMGENPVILFDDVLSELDNDRQDYLLNELRGCQVFITCCERSNKEQLNEGKIFYVENGIVEEITNHQSLTTNH